MTLTRRTMLMAGPLIVLAVAAHAVPHPFLINESPSLPRGLYVRSADQTVRAGAVVAVFPPAAGRAYLADLGWPEGLPLLKRVSAVGGERGERAVLLALGEMSQEEVMERFNERMETERQKASAIAE